MQNALVLVGLWAAQKIADAVADKMLEKALSAENLQRWAQLSKRQGAMLYLIWLLRTRSLRKLEKQ